MPEQEGIPEKLFEVFRQEAREHLAALSIGFLELEKALPGAKAPRIEHLAREVHSFKGAARAVHQTAIESACRSLENVLLAWKQERLRPDASFFSLLHRLVEAIEETVSRGESEKSRRGLTETVQQLELRLSAASPLSTASPPLTQEPAHRFAAHDEKEAAQPARPESVSSPGPAPDRAGPVATVRIKADQLDAMLHQSEELLPVRASFNESIAEMAVICEELESWRREFDTSDDFSQTGEHKEPDGRDWLEWSSVRLRDIRQRLLTQLGSMHGSAGEFSSILQRHLESIRSAYLEPFSVLAAQLEVMARDLLHEEGKQAEITLEGAEIEVDRRILQELKAPLMHLVRNAVDHGIESPRERVAKGKAERGTLAVKLESSDGSTLTFTVSDDGAGIDLEQIKQAALKSGVITPRQADAMERGEFIDLAFGSGISSSGSVSDISGRGLGLAIVRESAERLAGQVDVRTSPAGTSFYIIIPSTISSVRGVRVSVRGWECIIPTAFIERAARVSIADIRTVGQRDTILAGEETVALNYLDETLGLRGPNERVGDGDHVNVLIVRFIDKKLAVAVDRILDERNVRVKRLGPQLARVRMIAGATVTGEGAVLPVLNIADLLAGARPDVVKRTRAPGAATTGPVAGKAVLVVEDSITSRTLLKSILESSGYRVKTAVDGAEAYMILRTDAFDIVISDIDMPRMNGTELTRKIRADARLADMPVVLLSALESREDRERGIDAGANAYIVKSKFDSQNLIDTVRRLI